MLQLTSRSTLLFIGDSITDVGRRTDPDELGGGYVRLIRDYLAAKDPARAPRVVNRGVSGNKVPDLQKRWQRDVLDLRPDVLSVYIGINDVWHGLPPRNAGTPIDAYVAGYRELLRSTRAALPQVEIVLCEPSVLWLPDPPDANARLEPYVAVVHVLAREFGAACPVVPLHGAFDAARAARPDLPLTTDGVHPTSMGHMLIARTWLDVTGLL